MDYAPAQEISDEQLKRTAVSLYYLNTTTNEIIKDEKLISTKSLSKYICIFNTSSLRRRPIRKWYHKKHQL